MSDGSRREPAHSPVQHLGKYARVQCWGWPVPLTQPDDLTASFSEVPASRDLGSLLQVSLGMLQKQLPWD